MIAEILRLTEGAVEIVDMSEQLPELKRRPGMERWKLFDSNGEEIERSEFVPGGKIFETMFAPTSEEENIRKQLPRCIRVYPHLQDTGGAEPTLVGQFGTWGAYTAAPNGKGTLIIGVTGGFFIAVLEKKTALGAKKVDLPVTDEEGIRYSSSHNQLTSVLILQNQFQRNQN